jgi:hypothetical protein
LVINCSVSDKILEMAQGGIINNKASDGKESPLARNRRANSSFSLAATAAVMTVSVVDT